MQLCSLPFQQLSIRLLHKPGKNLLTFTKKQNKRGGTTIQKNTMENQDISFSSQSIRQVASNVLRSPRQNLTIQWQVKTMEPFCVQKIHVDFLTKILPRNSKKTWWKRAHSLRHVAATLCGIKAKLIGEVHNSYPTFPNTSGRGAMSVPGKIPLKNSKRHTLHPLP